MEPIILLVLMIGGLAGFRGRTVIQTKMGIGDSEKARLNRIEAQKQAAMRLEREHRKALAEVRMARNRELAGFDEQMEAIEGPRGFIAKKVDEFGGAKALEAEFEEELAARKRATFPTALEVLAVTSVLQHPRPYIRDQIVAMRGFLKEEWPDNPDSMEELFYLTHKRIMRFKQKQVSR